MAGATPSVLVMELAELQHGSTTLADAPTRGLRAQLRLRLTWNDMEQLIKDVIYACRAITRAPVLSAVVIASLAVGIGVNTAVFSWIQAFVFRPIPGVADAGSLYLIEPKTEAGLRPLVSWPEYQDLAARITSLPDLVAYRMVPFNVGEASRTERSYGLMVSGNYFGALDLSAEAGRLLTIDDARRGRMEPVVVISHDYWMTRYNASTGAIGQSLRVNNRDLTIVGVAPRGFQGTVIGLQFDLWVPATLAPVVLGSRELDDRGQRGYSVMGRLPSDRARAEVDAQAAAAMTELAQRHPETNAGVSAEVLPFWRALRGPQGFLLQALALLQGVMLLLLLAVCGNTANLVLARASVRQREIGVRLAVGAGWWRIVRLLLLENLMLALIGSALGAVLAMWATNALRATPMITLSVPVRFQTSVDAMGLLFAIGLGILCAGMFGAAPAMQLARVDPQMVLRNGAAMPPRNRLRNTLIGVQVGLASMVLIVAGLFLQSFRSGQGSDPGFKTEGVLLAAYDLTGRDTDDASERLFSARLLEQLRALPDVESAAIAVAMPLDIHGLPTRSFVLEGRARVDGNRDRALSNTVTPGYFAAMGIPILQGRDFVEMANISRPPEAMVNDAFVSRYLADGEVVGRQLEQGGKTFEITGVVRSSLYQSFGEPPTPIVYLSYRDRPYASGEIHVRTRLADEEMLAGSINRAVRALDATLPIYNVRTLTQHVDLNLALRKIPARMFVVLGPLLLILAATGIYAVVSYSVAHRTSEIGVRLALGATAERVVSQIVRESLRVIIVGAGVGWVIVYAVFIHLSPGAPIDLVAFVGVPAALLAVATFASWIPARRAAQLDPTTALRAD
ncbi:MAG TPA: ADOP family duplicated permease [Vicinamibacterales bacterium]|nr:ADOP family duplicated permease [Vicinamibacterales bacterium]